MKILIINKESKQIESSYEESSSNQSKFGGPWGDSSLYSHIALPENVQLEAAQCNEDFSISEDSIKKQAYIDQQRLNKLDQLRAIRDEKLKRVDQLINVAFLDAWTAGEKLELRDYRDSLLNITESYKADMSLCDALDMNTIVWPIEL